MNKASLVWQVIGQLLHGARHKEGTYTVFVSQDEDPEVKPNFHLTSSQQLTAKNESGHGLPSQYIKTPVESQVSVLGALVRTVHASGT